MILTRPGQPRQEVELVGPPASADSPAEAAAETPTPLCPHAAPASSAAELTSLAPGQSWYDTPAPEAKTDGSPAVPQLDSAEVPRE